MLDQVLDKAVADFLLHLLDIGAIQIAGDNDPGFRFKLHETNPDAQLSPVKLHLCTALVRPEGRLTQADIDQVGRLFEQYRKRHGLLVNAVAGLPNAGDPLAAAFRKAMLPRKVALITLGKTTDPNGHRHISHVIDTQGCQNYAPVSLVDDVATRADTKREAVVLLRDQYSVRDCYVFLRYGPRPVEELERMNVDLHAMATMRQTIELFRERGRITDTQYARLSAYLEEQHGA